jgi:hypothetical protein
MSFRLSDMCKADTLTKCYDVLIENIIKTKQHQNTYLSLSSDDSEDDDDSDTDNDKNYIDRNYGENLKVLKIIKPVEQIYLCENIINIHNYVKETNNIQINICTNNIIHIIMTSCAENEFLDSYMKLLRDEINASFNLPHFQDMISAYINMCYYLFMTTIDKDIDVTVDSDDCDEEYMENYTKIRTKVKNYILLLTLSNTQYVSHINNLCLYLYKNMTFYNIFKEICCPFLTENMLLYISKNKMFYNERGSLFNLMIYIFGNNALSDVLFEKYCDITRLYVDKIHMIDNEQFLCLLNFSEKRFKRVSNFPNFINVKQKIYKILKKLHDKHEEIEWSKNIENIHSVVISLLMENKIPQDHSIFLNKIFSFESSKKIASFIKLRYNINITPDDYIDYLNTTDNINYEKIMIHKTNLFILLKEHEKINPVVLINILITFHYLNDPVFVELIEQRYKNKIKYNSMLIYTMAQISIDARIKFILDDIEKNDTISKFHDIELYRFISLNKAEFHEKLYEKLKINKSLYNLTCTVEHMHELLLKHDNNTYNISCPICYCIPRDVYIYDCMHQICLYCAEKSDHKCGICRKKQNKRKLNLL